MEISNIERMIIAAGREINDNENVFTGTYWPLVACVFAKMNHAKSINLIFEAGYVCDAIPPRIPLLSGDPCLAAASSCVGDSFTTLGMILHGGWCDVAVLSGANVDRFGNINTTCIGPYRSPTKRMAGSGGGCDLSCLAKKTIILLEHDRMRFPEKVDFITSPGYLYGEGTRYEAGLIKGTGPSRVVTTLGVFGFDNENKEMMLESFYENTSVDQIKRSVQWPLRVSDTVKQLAPPSDAEIDVLRDQVDPKGMFINRTRFAGRQTGV